MALLYSLFIIGKAPENHGKIVYTVGNTLLKIVSSKKLRYKLWKLCDK